MALDLHAARSKRDAIRRQRLHLAFDELAHDCLFGNGDLSRRFPLLARLSDYYSDATFHCQELDAFRQEISRAIVEFPEVSVHDMLVSLDRLCRDAKNGGLNLYAFCD